MTVKATDLKVKVFADGADKAGIVRLNQDPLIRGFTTNPTLMKQAGITSYEAFARDILSAIRDKPFSFEVFSDEWDEMERQALKITAWGKNVYVKIPITNTKGESSTPLVKRLAARGVKLNITAMMTLQQVEEVSAALAGGPPCYISVFAGRIADTGRDPLAIMTQALQVMSPHPNQELIWASPREVLNIIQANSIGCHIITVTHDLLKKLSTLTKDLDEFSLDTVKMFYNDAKAAGFSL